MKPEAQRDGTDVSRSELNPSSNSPGSTTIQESHSVAIERSGSSAERGSKATGPRTQQGKETASRNATKHGVFSKVIVLGSESEAEYDELLAGLCESLQPEGTFEELLVEKLATNIWRQRRLLLAESAEIRKNTEFVESDRRNQEREGADKLLSMSVLVAGHGLTTDTHNQLVFEQCLEWLANLRDGVKEVGFRPDQDVLILRKLYGDRGVSRLSQDLYDIYETCLQNSKRKGYPSLEERRRTFIENIDSEIQRIRRDQEARASIETARIQLEMQRRNVPDPPRLDRLLRYEASLERSFDRTLSQLERLRRMRLGQLVLPELEVRHSLS
jgi:hypothetical protein